LAIGRHINLREGTGPAHCHEPHHRGKRLSQQSDLSGPSAGTISTKPRLLGHALFCRATLVKTPPEKPGAGGHLPVEPSIPALREAAAGRTNCHLYRTATQTVFGEGPQGSLVMLIDEQPGDAEDLAGHPFVRPAGKSRDRCLVEAGIDRARTYVTNVDKH